MSRPMVRIYTGNGEFIDREMNDEELAQYKIDQADSIARASAKAQAKAEAQAKRQVLLDKLGITEDEARLLLGGN